MSRFLVPNAPTIGLMIALHDRVDDVRERGTDDYRDRQVDDVAARQEGLEALQDALLLLLAHRGASLHARDGGTNRSATYVKAGRPVQSGTSTR